MHFAFSEEQEEFRRQVRKWLSENSSSSQVRSLMETEQGFDRGQWSEMAALGWQAMAIPETFGGAGFGYLELAILFEEMGSTLYPTPFLSTVGLAAPLILELGNDSQKREWLGAIANGEKVIAVAFTEPEGAWDLSAIATTASPDGDGWILDGTKSFVIDGAAADDLLVSARTPNGIGVFLLSGGATSRRPLETMDQTRRLAEVVLDEVKVRSAALLGDDRQGSDALGRVIEKALVLLAAEQVGGAQRCLDMAVEYAKTRHQFGRPIGSFQAIKHKCADMLVQVESAKSAAAYAGLGRSGR